MIACRRIVLTTRRQIVALRRVCRYPVMMPIPRAVVHTRWRRRSTNARYLPKDFRLRLEHPLRRERGGSNKHPAGLASCAARNNGRESEMSEISSPRLARSIAAENIRKQRLTGFALTMSPDSDRQAVFLGNSGRFIDLALRRESISTLHDRYASRTTRQSVTIKLAFSSRRCSPVTSDGDDNQAISVWIGSGTTASVATS